jgi:hypothetical protein
MKEEYEKDKYNWFPDETTKESKAYNKRTPGLFKVEFEGNSMYALNSKLYFVEGDRWEKLKKVPHMAKGRVQRKLNF